MATYIIKSGDTLGSIAAANGTTVDTLAKSNNIADPNKIYAGSNLNLPDATPPAVVAPASTINSGAMTDAFSGAGKTGPVVVPPGNAPITTDALHRGTQLPDPSTLVDSSPKASLNDMVTKVAGSTLDSTGKAIDTLRARQQADAEAQIATEKAAKDGVTTQITDQAAKVKTADQDALAAGRAKFNIDQTIATLEDTQTKIAAAQEALNMGLVYEQDRPVREQLILGRAASLQKQGLATIGALQATAQILQGNIDLAESYVKATTDAINTDNTNTSNALKTLLDLHDNNLIKLNADEKATVDARIKALSDQDTQLKTNQKDIFDLMSKYPSAAVAGGVTLLDDKATAIKKMLPKMSQMEMTQFNSDIAAKNRSGANKDDKDGPAADKQQLLSLKANGMTYPEALNAYSDTLSVDWINSVYREADPKNTSSKDQLLNAYYGDAIDPATGKPKTGYTVSVDEKGNPIVTKTDKGPGWLGGIWNSIFGTK